MQTKHTHTHTHTQNTPITNDYCHIKDLPVYDGPNSTTAHCACMATHDKYAY